MATTTDYLGLTLPEGSDNADISVLNTAFKKIESGIQAIDEWQYIGVYNFGSGADNEGVSRWTISSVNLEHVRAIRMLLDDVTFASNWSPLFKYIWLSTDSTYYNNAYWNYAGAYSSGTYSGYCDFRFFDNAFDARSRDKKLSRVVVKTLLGGTINEFVAAGYILSNGCGFSVAPTGGTLRIFVQTRPGV